MSKVYAVIVIDVPTSDDEEFKIKGIGIFDNPNPKIMGFSIVFFEEEADTYEKAKKKAIERFNMGGKWWFLKPLLILG